MTLLKCLLRKRLSSSVAFSILLGVDTVTTFLTVTAMSLSLFELVFDPLAVFFFPTALALMLWLYYSMHSETGMASVALGFGLCLWLKCSDRPTGWRPP